MLNSKEIRRSAAHELRALFSRATDWQEFADYKSGAQRADLLLKFKMGATEHALAVEITSLGQPREITWRGKTVYTSVWKEPVQLKTNRR